MGDERTDPAVALAGQQVELLGLLDGLDAADWGRPSPCEGWDVADVVLHLAQTNEMAVGSLQGRFDEVLAALAAGTAPTADIDDGAARMVERDRPAGAAAAHARLRTSIEDLRGAVAATDPHARVTWVAGTLAARTLVSTRVAETWIHTTDVAAAVGVALPATDRLFHVARLAWRTLPYALAGEGRVLAGPVAFELTAPTGGTWSLAEGPPTTVVAGSALDLCRVAGRRVDPADTDLVATGPDADHVLRLVRTYA